jgi:Zn-dependent peptidase ImmA (M78 family)
MRQQLVKHTERQREWSDRELNDLAKVFHVSREVILRRILSLGKTSKTFYKQKHEEWAKKGEPMGPRGGGGGRRMPQECVSQNGKPFVSLVIESYRNERITYNDMADYLEVNVKHIPMIEKLIEAH